MCTLTGKEDFFNEAFSRLETFHDKNHIQWNLTFGRLYHSWEMVAIACQSVMEALWCAQSALLGQIFFYRIRPEGCPQCVQFADYLRYESLPLLHRVAPTVLFGYCLWASKQILPFRICNLWNFFHLHHIFWWKRLKDDWNLGTLKNSIFKLRSFCCWAM